LVGIDPDYAPFEYVDSTDSAVIGFDVDLIARICEANRWQYEIVPTPFEALLQDVTLGRLDIGISAISITPERETLVAFSDPYYLSGQTIAVPLADSSIADPSDLRGKRVGVLRGTTGEALVKRYDGVLVYPYDEVGAALLDLVAGQLDAVLNDYPVTRHAMDRVAGARLLPVMVSTEYYGIAMRTTDTLRLRLLNDALAGLCGGYSYEQLHMKWFGYPLLDLAVPDSVANQWRHEE
jgi:polar amino acid transport system substrate-binding protein